MSKYNYPAQGAQNQARVVEHDRSGHLTRQAASRLVEFDWGTLGMRGVDVKVFAKAAFHYSHIIAVRSTNMKSLRHIGEPGYVPKPSDCKPKTADLDSYLYETGSLVKCSGLVIDPTVFGDAAFNKPEKARKAKKVWTDFLRCQTENERQRKIFRRRAAKGFFAVDTDRMSKHYGCVMLSDQEVPSRDFSLHTAAWADFKRTNMKYIHGDYDLYGLIDVEKTNKAIKDSGGHDNYSRVLEKTIVNGKKKFDNQQFEKFRIYLNREIGVPMIQHGEQDILEHINDTLYVFYPDGNMYQVTASADAFRDIYARVFRQDVTT